MLIVMSMGSEASDEILSLEKQMVSYFSDGAKLLGLPKSVGEMYGLLYSSREPLAMDEMVQRLEISKGSASQGIKMLRTLGAVLEENKPGDRKTYYKADVELKRLVGGFIKEEIRPHMESGSRKLKALEGDVDALPAGEEKEFLLERVERLERWSKRVQMVLPLLQKFLGTKS